MIQDLNTELYKKIGGKVFRLLLGDLAERIKMPNGQTLVTAFDALGLKVDAVEADVANAQFMANENATAISSLATRLPILDANIKQRGIYNDQEFITQTGTWTAKVTGYHLVMIIDGGEGGYIRDDGLGYGGVGGMPQCHLVHLVKDQQVPVTIGAAGQAIIGTVTNTSAKNRGKSMFGDLVSNLFTNPCNNWLRSNNDRVKSCECYGGGLCGGSPNSENAVWYGGGGGVFYQSSDATITHKNAGNGYQGCVIVFYYDPEKGV